LEVVCESEGKELNPLVGDGLDDDLGLMIIRNLAESITHQWRDGKNRLEFLLK